MHELADFEAGIFAIHDLHGWLQQNDIEVVLPEFLYFQERLESIRCCLDHEVLTELVLQRGQVQDVGAGDKQMLLDVTLLQQRGTPLFVLGIVD